LGSEEGLIAFVSLLNQQKPPSGGFCVSGVSICADALTLIL